MVFTFLWAVVLFLVSLLPRFAMAWILSFVVLVLTFSTAKSRVRERVTAFDESVRYWAGGLRYRLREDLSTDRIARTWFFRFWTNFASAPSLSTLSLLIPFWFLYKWISIRQNELLQGGTSSIDMQRALSANAHWLFPGVCYAGSMLLSFVIKRYFKRQRPPREGKAFGYKLKDPSFPSGHSLTSFCFWLPLAFIVAQSSMLSLIGVAVFCALAVTIVLLTGLSRVYLGVHFPSDVLGGFTIGAVWCVACYFAIYPMLQSAVAQASVG
jgi:membrane-associated phospholipid phosphatase